MPDEVLLTGGGVAACCCASLLTRAGVTVFRNAEERAGSPVLMLSDQTQLLLRDVFQEDGLFEGATKIKNRVVAWGRNEPLTLPHSGLVMFESVLLSRLWPMVRIQSGSCSEPAWRILSSKSALPPVAQHEFGLRTASTNEVLLNDSAGCESCWVESVKNGWLFLLPCGEKRGSLIAVGASTQELLNESRLIERQIASLGRPTGKFPAHPRVVQPLCGPGWISCGTAAIAFDPIAGEGAGNAIREGILASAVICAALKNGAFQEDLLLHYSSRMLSGFLRHLQECCQFYSTDSSPWWHTELDRMKEGVRWTHAGLAPMRKSVFRLIGFELVAVD